MLNFFKRKNKQKPESLPVSSYDAPTIMIPKDQQVIETIGEEAKQPDDTSIVISFPDTPAEYFFIETGIATHIGTRKYQQDNGYVSDSVKDPESEVFGIVCDGMGGMSSGDLASADVVKYFVETLSGAEKNCDIPALLVKTAHESNEILLNRYTKQGNDAGTTLSCVYIVKNQLYWISIGDSRIFMIRGEEMASLTREHNHALQLQELVVEGKMSQDEANSSANREALVSYIGAPTLDYIDISNSPLTLFENDIILICSDGLTKTLTEQEIMNLLSEKLPVADAVHRLVITAIDESLGGQDNTTAILIRYNGDEKVAELSN